MAARAIVFNECDEPTTTWRTANAKDANLRVLATAVVYNRMKETWRRRHLPVYQRRMFSYINELFTSEFTTLN